ncbi:MAG: hypothetical protein K9I68_04205 [Bacteroidales bacterium]|nr:hypothetical protein [Bacteroidales bacterium]MCF8336566.1 hypothetical protein [Bacteroidales bacterium]
MRTYHVLLLMTVLQFYFVEGKATSFKSEVEIIIPDSSQNELYIWKLRYFSSKAEKIDTTLKREVEGVFHYTLNHKNPVLIRILPDTGFAKGTRMLINPEKYFYYTMCHNFYNKGLDLFLEPGESLEIRVPDARDFRYSARFSGNGASKQKFLRHFRDEFNRLAYNDEIGLQTTSAKDLNKKKLLKKTNKAKKKLLGMLEAKREVLTPTAANYLKNEIIFKTLNRRILYLNNFFPEFVKNSI